MLHGIVEELGEMITSENDEELLDAAADFMIYASSYCNHKNWDMQKLWDERELSMLTPVVSLLKAIGKLSHHHLKAEQKIRGKEEFHNEEGQKWLKTLFAQVEAYGARRIVNFDLPRVACDVWRLEVKPRSWVQQGEVQPARVE